MPKNNGYSYTGSGTNSQVSFTLLLHPVTRQSQAVSQP